MASVSRNPIFGIGPGGELFALNAVAGFRELPDGRLIFAGQDNSALAIIDPDGYDGVDRDEAIRALRRMVLDANSGKPVVQPDWMKSIVA